MNTRKKNTKRVAAKPAAKLKSTLVVFVLDRSGSMASCATETISGFNAYIDELKAQKQTGMRFSMVQFDSQGIDTLYTAAELADVKHLNDATFLPRGGTPLYDAIGKTVNTNRPDTSKHKVLFVTLTDGAENASVEFSLDAIRSLIKEMEDKHAWTFAHIGVGVAGWEAAQKYAYGTLSASNIMRSESDAVSQQRQYRRLAGQTISYCSTAMGSAKTVTDFWVDPNEGKKRKK